MSSKFLDYSGLSYLWGKIVAWTKRTLTNNVSYNTTSHTIQQTKCNGTNDAQTTTDIVSASTIVTDGGGITSHLTVDNKALTLVWGQTKTIATIGSTDITVKMPSNPNTDNCTDAINDTSTSLYLIGATELVSSTRTYSNEDIKINVGKEYTSLDAPYFNGVGLTRDARSGFSITGEDSITLNVGNSYTLNSACAKAVDTSISANSTSENLPTSLAVENRIQAAISGSGSVGTLDTTATTAQTTSSSESLSGNVTLHKIAKTGTYSDLIGKPTIPDDSNLVHISGSESITGEKSFNQTVNINGIIDFHLTGDNANKVISLYRGEDETASGHESMVLEIYGDGVSTEAIIRGANTPVEDYDVATKGYVDNIVGGIETLLASI